METGDWITLSAVITALGLGVWANIQARNIQINERKQRLINEIIDWALDVGKCGRDIEFILLASRMDEEPWGELSLPNIQANLRELAQRGKYMTRVANVFVNDLINTVDEVEETVREHLITIDKIFIGTRLGSEGTIEMILTPLSELNSLVNSSNSLIILATKVKTDLLNP